MGRARQGMESTVSGIRRRGPVAVDDAFASTFGEGRGLSAAQTATRESDVPRPFEAVDGDSGVSVSYYRHNDEAAGVLHREDGPAFTKEWPSGKRIDAYYIDGSMHREGGAAYIETLGNGTHTEEWYAHGQRHRDGNPARVSADPFGYREEMWYEHDVQHRDGGPAVIRVFSGGERVERYYTHGKHLRSG